MRPYRNISDEELASFGAAREWCPEAAKELDVDSKLLWVHNRRQKFNALDARDKRLIREVEVRRVRGDFIKTDFGTYSLHTGRNMHESCGCNPYCDCYGRLYQFRSC